jgi:hypothetical protein
MLNTSGSGSDYDALASLIGDTGNDVNFSCCANCSYDDCTSPSSSSSTSDEFSTADAQGPSQFERIVGTAVPSLFGLIVVVGLAGNLVVVLVVALHRRARTATSLLMLNLAVADLLFIVVCVPSTAARYALPFWPFGLVWCKVRDENASRDCIAD